MLNLMPEELFTATCQLVCFGCVMVTAVATFFWTPRW